VPGNLCNSYRIKPRGRQLIRGWRKGGGGWCNHKATDTHKYPPTYIYFYMALTIESESASSFASLGHINCTPPDNVWHSLLFYLYFLFICFFFLFFGTKTTKLHWVGAAAGGIGPKPKAQSQSQLIADSGHVNYYIITHTSTSLYSNRDTHIAA